MSSGIWRCPCGADVASEECPDCGYTMSNLRERVRLERRHKRHGGLTPEEEGQLAAHYAPRVRRPPAEHGLGLAGEQGLVTDTQRVPWEPGELRPLRVGDGFTIAGHEYQVTEVLARGRFRLKLVGRP